MIKMENSVAQPHTEDPHVTVTAEETRLKFGVEKAPVTTHSEQNSAALRTSETDVVIKNESSADHVPDISAMSQDLGTNHADIEVDASAMRHPLAPKPVGATLPDH